MSGEKNARLICITDDNSIEEPIEDQNNCKTRADTKTIAKTSSETQTDVKAAHRKVCVVLICQSVSQLYCYNFFTTFNLGFQSYSKR